MTIPTGNVNYNHFNAEVGNAANTAIDLNNSCLRTLAGKTAANSTISVNDLQGKTVNPMPLAASYTVSGSNPGGTAFAEIIVSFFTSLTLRVQRSTSDAPSVNSDFNYSACGQASSNFQVQFTNITFFGATPSIINGASTYQTISQIRQLGITLNNNNPGTIATNGSFTINIRRVSNNSVVNTRTVDFNLTATQFNDGGGGFGNGGVEP